MTNDIIIAQNNSRTAIRMDDWNSISGISKSRNSVRNFDEENMRTFMTDMLKEIIH